MGHTKQGPVTMALQALTLIAGYKSKAIADGSAGVAEVAVMLNFWPSDYSNSTCLFQTSSSIIQECSPFFSTPSDSLIGCFSVNHCSCCCRLASADGAGLVVLERVHHGKVAPSPMSALMC